MTLDIAMVLADDTSVSDLIRIASVTFKTAYVGQIPAETLDVHIASSFTEEKMLDQIQDPKVQVYLVQIPNTGENIGYIILKDHNSESIPSDNQMELTSIYLLESYKKQGLGSILMKKVHDIARVKPYEVIWLGVWEHNTSAIEFYQKWGFQQAGTIEFDLAGKMYTDLLYYKTLKP